MKKSLRGQRVGKYELLAPLSRGGMSQLTLGFTRGPGGFRKYVVIKRIIAHAQTDEAFVRMFLDEARVTAAFSHPFITQVFDLGEDDEGLYVVMELVAGQNLNQVTAACAAQQEVLPLGFSVSTVRDCALALHYAHTFVGADGQPAPVVHRDVAHKNIMVTYDGQVKLLDFGIAKATKALARTRVGTVKGTSGYMSPEQVQGQALDGRSDVFSLGVVLWELSTGRRLFAGESELDELRRIVDADIPLAQDIEPVVPQALGLVLARALERDVTRRWPSAKALARALEQECPRLLVDDEARAGFMVKLFSREQEASRRLLELANDERDEAVEELLQQRASSPSREPDPEVRRPSTARVPVRPPAVRATPAGVRVPEPPARELAVEAAVPEEALAVSPGPSRTTLWGAWLAVAVAVAGGAAVFLLRGAEEAVPQAPRPDRPFQASDSVGEPLPREEAGPAPAEAPAAVRRSPAPAGQGQVTLVLLPEAQVLLKGRELARGNLLSLTLPVGTHLLTVVGPDGVPRALSMPVKAGKNAPMKLQVADLPPR